MLIRARAVLWSPNRWCWSGVPELPLFTTRSVSRTGLQSNTTSPGVYIKKKNQRIGRYARGSPWCFPLVESLFSHLVSVFSEENTDWSWMSLLLWSSTRAPRRAGDLRSALERLQLGCPDYIQNTTVVHYAACSSTTCRIMTRIVLFWPNNTPEKCVFYEL